MKHIILNKTSNRQHQCIVDDSLYSALNKFGWSYNKYAYRHIRVGGKTKKIYMHRLIMGAGSNQQIDHINGNRLDNRLCNLRFATPSQNAMNSRPRKKFKGVYYDKRGRRYYAYIWKDYKRTFLGGFSTEYAAANAYNVKAIELFGEYAKLNIIKDNNAI